MGTPTKDKPYFAHPTAAIDGENEANGFVDPNIGAGTKMWHNVHVSNGAKIGERCSMGQNVFIAPTVVMGKNCKLQNNVNVYEGCVLEDHIFCGPSMTFTNLSSPLPRSAIPRRSMYQQTLVRTQASIGANACIVCGNELGRACFVAAGSTVIRDVPAYALVAGTPAKIKGWVCECGHRLHFDEKGETTCENKYEFNDEEITCGRSYRKESETLVVKTLDPHPEP
jgi:UDP-2-acetamido-3-amino-2,3-dideoxy-glucuronate N-acetyltransferase